MQCLLLAAAGFARLPAAGVLPVRYQVLRTLAHHPSNDVWYVFVYLKASAKSIDGSSHSTDTNGFMPYEYEQQGYLQKGFL